MDIVSLSRWSHERALAETLQFITGGIKPLDNKGQQAWPKIGDVANIVLIEASCSAEAIARTSKRKMTIYKGNIVTE